MRLGEAYFLTLNTGEQSCFTTLILTKVYHNLGRSVSERVRDAGATFECNLSVQQRGQMHGVGELESGSTHLQGAEAHHHPPGSAQQATGAVQQCQHAYT